MASHRALVVGGSGFLGSAICRACVQRGWEVVSLSRNGEPAYAEHGNTSEPGKKPEWANQVEWVKGSAFDEALVKSLMPKSTAVVHTLGILLESDYKSRGVSSLASSIARGFRENRDLADDRANPLSTSYRSATPPSSSGTSGQRGGKYETINRDSALAVLRACLETPATRHPGTAPKPEPTETPFVYISAEDVFRPVIPARYIATKREAEVGIQRLAETARAMLELGREQDNEFEDLERPGRLVRPILVRPSLIYDPQVRPLSALPAALLSLSASVQARLPASLQAHTGSSIFSALTSRYSSARPDLPSASESVANLLSIPPIRVDEVAQAVVRSIEEKDIRGVVGVRDMQALLAGRGPSTAGFGHHPRASHPYPQA